MGAHSEEEPSGPGWSVQDPCAPSSFPVPGAAGKTQSADRKSEPELTRVWIFISL